MSFYTPPKAKSAAGFRITFNSPVILSFTFLACAVLVADYFMLGKIIPAFFTAHAVRGVMDVPQLVTYVLGHADWTHLINNFTFILILGPALEEKYGAPTLLSMIAVTAITSALASVYVLDVGLKGASGIVFMMILLSSFTNSKAGTLPLTFVLVAPLFLAKELVAGFRDDNVSQFAHVAGGVIGAIFGYFRR